MPEVAFLGTITLLPEDVTTSLFEVTELNSSFLDIRFSFYPIANPPSSIRSLPSNPSSDYLKYSATTSSPFASLGRTIPVALSVFKKYPPEGTLNSDPPYLETTLDIKS